MPYAGYTAEEVVQRGEDLYNQQIRPNVESENRGKYLVMDVISGDYEIDTDDLAASNRLIGRKPDAIV